MAKAKFKHDPAANGECSSCHAPHQSGFGKLLIKDGRQTCFECHDEKEMAGVKAHQRAVAARNCSECHDPHQGEDKHFLRPGAARGGATKP